MESFGSFFVSDSWLFERLRTYLRRRRLHPRCLLMNFVEKYGLHVGVPVNVIRKVYHRGISAFQPIRLHHSFSLESGKQIKINCGRVNSKQFRYLFPVQGNRFTFTSINPRGSVLKPPISCNSSFTSDVIWIFEAAKINVQRRLGWCCVAYLRQLIPSCNNKME